MGVVSDCTFCHGAPVYNAGRWVAPDERAIAACPRCGKRYCPSCGVELVGNSDECHVCPWEAVA